MITPPFSFAPRLFAGLGAATFVAGVGLFASSRPAHSVGGPVPVTVGNTVHVQDLDNAARQPFQTEVGIASTTSFSTATFSVPSGKQLVLENISAIGYTGSDPDAEVVVTTTAGGQTVSQSVGFASILLRGNRVMPIVPVRLYADGGSTVTVDVQLTSRIPQGKTYDTKVSLSGYLVDVP